eukprot:COSAG01_NODE_57906_length_309_cov_0.985714_2_plen_40_part_01
MLLPADCFRVAATGGRTDLARLTGTAAREASNAPVPYCTV